jgi:hypothetical protein
MKPLYEYKKWEQHQQQQDEMAHQHPLMTEGKKVICHEL